MECRRASSLCWSAAVDEPAAVQRWPELLYASPDRAYWDLRGDPGDGRSKFRLCGRHRKSAGCHCQMLAMQRQPARKPAGARRDRCLHGHPVVLRGRSWLYRALGCLAPCVAAGAERPRKLTGHGDGETARALCFLIFGQHMSDPRLITLGSSGIALSVLILARICRTSSVPVSAGSAARVTGPPGSA